MSYPTSNSIRISSEFPTPAAQTQFGSGCRSTFGLAQAKVSAAWASASRFRPGLAVAREARPRFRSRAAPPSTRGRERGDWPSPARNADRPDDIEPKLEIRKIAHFVSTPRRRSAECVLVQIVGSIFSRRVSANFSVRFTSNWRFTTWSLPRAVLPRCRKWPVCVSPLLDLLPPHALGSSFSTAASPSALRLRQCKHRPA